MLLRLLITASLLLALAKYYLHDSKDETVRPKAQLDQAEQQLDRALQQAEKQKQELLEKLDRQ